MGLARRRNSISQADAWWVAGIAAVSGVAATFSDAAPTASSVADAMLVAGFAALVTWLGASASWWALMAAGIIAILGAIGGPLWVTGLAVVATATSGLIGWRRDNMPIVRAVCAALVTQAALRLDWNPFFLASAIAAGVALALIAVVGLLRRQRYVRVRAYWALGAVAVVVVLVGAGAALSAVRARGAAQDGYQQMLDGLDEFQRGDTVAASATLADAAENLRAATDRLDSVWTQPIRLVPGVAQNRNASVDVLEQAARAADSAASTLSMVDLGVLTITDGRIDVDAIADLQAPLADLEVTVDDLREALDTSRSPWLVAPLASRLDAASERADRVGHQARATAATARIAPSMLGQDGPRRYLLAFVNSAEARGTGGLMGNWSEVTVDDGTFEVTANGRTADLESDALEELRLDVTNEYIQRYGQHGATAAADDGVLPKFWSNVTMPADMPSVGLPIAQMYAVATERDVDGVFVIDPVGLGALVDVIGSIEVNSVDRELNGEELERFLIVDQYEIDEADREAILEEITATTVAEFVTGSLPEPQQIAEVLADPALHGHITGWAAREDEQPLFELVGMDGRLPRVADSDIDGLAVVNNNASGNKIDSFLRRTVDYRPVVDERTGEVTATLTITLTNEAPRSGYPDYVIGNIIDEPVGTNRTLLDVYTRLDVESATLDGEFLPPHTEPELGYRVLSRLVSIPPGDTATVELQLTGTVGAGPYRLAYRPQALPEGDHFVLDATTTGGSTIVSYDDDVERRTVFSADGTSAWR